MVFVRGTCCYLEEVFCGIGHRHDGRLLSMFVECGYGDCLFGRICGVAIDRKCSVRQENILSIVAGIIVIQRILGNQLAMHMAKKTHRDDVQRMPPPLHGICRLNALSDSPLVFIQTYPLLCLPIYNRLIISIRTSSVFAVPPRSGESRCPSSRLASTAA